jgi:glutamate-1-semialdehyde 2,1-aminomutase
MQSAKGTSLIDIDGNRYTDYCMAWGPLITGHQDPDVKEAVSQALSRGWAYGTAEPLSLELAEFITQNVPWVQKVRFVNSGTEAVMAALRVARAATGRTKILKFDGCYHGHADSMLVRAGSGLAEMASPDSAGVSQNVAAETVVVPLDNPAALEEAFHLHGKEIAAVIIEGIPANNGLLLQKEDFMAALCKTARSHGALVIFDEVITGFRVAFGGIAEKMGLIPDLVTYGKVLGGGFTVGAYGGKAELMDLVAPAGPVYQAGTFSANPIAMTAGLTFLKKLKKLNPYGELEKRTELLAKEIECALANIPGMLVKVQRYGSIFWTVFGNVGTDDGVVRSQAQIPSSQKESYARLFHFFLERGIYLSPSGYEVSFLSTAHEEYQLQELIGAAREFRQSL